MKQVTVRKQELKEILHKNRTEHRGIFAAANAKYREQLKELLQEELTNLANNKPVDPEKLVRLIKPKNFTVEYDRAILMLEMEQADVVVLDTNDFRRFVQDEWEWSQQWAISNSRYTSSPKFQPHLGDE